MASDDRDISQVPDTAASANSSLDDVDGADTKMPKGLISSFDELTIASFTYRQLQECAKQYGIPSNLKKDLLADLVTARLKGRVHYVNQKIAEVQSERTKMRQMNKVKERKKPSNEQGYSTFARIILSAGRNNPVLKQEPSSHRLENRPSTSTHTNNSNFGESSSQLLLKQMMNKCPARNVTITQTQSHTPIHMRPSLLDNCAQLKSQSLPLPPNPNLHPHSSTFHPPSTNIPPQRLSLPPNSNMNSPCMMQAGCSSNQLSANTSDYLPPHNPCSAMPPQFDVQRAPQMNFPARNVQVAATATVSMLQNGNTMHFYNANSSDYQKPEERNRMSVNPRCPPAVDELGIQTITTTKDIHNQRQPLRQQQQPLPWNMNSYQNYPNGNPTPVQDFRGLDNKFVIRPALPFTKTIGGHNNSDQIQQGVPLEQSYREGTKDSQRLPSIDNILPSFHFEHHFPPSTIGSDLAVANTTRHSMFQECETQERNMNSYQNYQNGYPTPVQDFGGLDNEFVIRPALPFTEMIGGHNNSAQIQQGVPLEQSYREGTMDSQRLPSIDNILPSFHFEHHFPPSTIGSNLAVANTTRHSMFQECETQERFLTERTPDQSHLSLQSETVTGRIMDQNISMPTPNQINCRYGCNTFLKSEEERRTHGDYCLKLIVTCPKPGCEWRYPIESLSTHIFNNHNLEIYEGDEAIHYFDLRQVNFTGESPWQYCIFHHAGRRLFIINFLFNNEAEEIFISIQYLNDHNPSIPTAELEVVGVDGNPLQWAKRLSLYNANTSPHGGGNNDPMRWVGTVHPISTSVTELTARRSCLIMRTNQLASQHGFKLHVVIRPHLLQHQ